MSLLDATKNEANNAEIKPVLEKLVCLTEQIFASENMNEWTTHFKFRVWATYAKVDKKRGKKYIQYGEACAMYCSHEDKGKQRFLKESRLCSSDYRKSMGIFWLVVHEVAHALDFERKGKMGHNRTHKRTMRELYEKYQREFLPKIENMFWPEEDEADLFDEDWENDEWFKEYSGNLVQI